MAITALSTGQTKKITHPDDTENPTVFVIQALSARAKAFINDQCIISRTETELDGEGQPTENRKSVTQTLIGSIGYLNMSLGLRAIENFSDKDGKPLKFKTRVVDLGQNARWTAIDEAAFDALDQDVRQWLAMEISNFASPKKDEAKN